MMAMNTRRLIAPKIVTAAGGAALIAVGAATVGTKGVVAAQLAFSLAYLVWIVLLNRRHAAPSWSKSPALAKASPRWWNPARPRPTVSPAGRRF